MMTAIELPRPGQHQAETGNAGREALCRVAALVLGLATLADGAALVVLGFAGHPALGYRISEVAFGIAVAVPGLLTAKAAIPGGKVHLGVLLPEIVLAGALLSLGVAMPAFHQGAVTYHTALWQFVLVLSGLGLGSAGLVLSGVTAPSSERWGHLSFPGAVRDGVILIVGTILLAISIGQLAGAKLIPPMWNWISFVGITIPGMLILIAREFVKQGDLGHDYSRAVALGRGLLTELMLVGGLFVMIYGSGANLTLGKNGYATGFKGNSSGLMLVVAAVVFLAVVRGVAKRAVPHRRAASVSLVGNVAYVAGAIALIYGERSIVMGKAPAFKTGAAATDAFVILVTGLVILVIGRTLASARAISLAENPHAAGAGKGAAMADQR